VNLKKIFFLKLIIVLLFSVQSYADLDWGGGEIFFETTENEPLSEKNGLAILVSVHKGNLIDFTSFIPNRSKNLITPGSTITHEENVNIVLAVSSMFYKGYLFSTAIQDITTEKQKYFGAKNSEPLYLIVFNKKTFMDDRPISGSKFVALQLFHSNANNRDVPAQTYGIGMPYNSDIIYPIDMNTVSTSQVLNNNQIASPYPSDGAKNVSIEVTLTWDLVYSKNSYDIYFWKNGEDKPDLPSAYDLSMPNYRPEQALLVNTTYNWQVIAKGGQNICGDEWSFTTDSNVNHPIIEDQVFSVDENSPISLSVGTVVASDMDNDTLTFNIEKKEIPFTINEKTGELKVSNSFLLNHEVAQVYHFIVQVSDGRYSDSAIITININNLNDTSPIVTDQIFGVYERSAKGTLVGYIKADDKDNDPMSYKIISGNSKNIFKINNNTILVENDFLLLRNIVPSYRLIIQVSDSKYSDNANITINVYENIQRIPLHKGWNQISFGVNKCYYIDEKPTVSMIEGIEYIKVKNIGEILSSIDEQYSFVKAFDSEGEKFYDHTSFSNMKYMAAGYGYLINIKEGADFDNKGLIYLELIGTQASDKTPIQLHEGLNLVGYLGNKVQYLGKEPTVPFPNVRVMFSCNDLSDIFMSIDGKYSEVMGLDQTGAKVYNLTLLSNMKYVGPGYGYWMKVNTNELTKLKWVK